MRKKLLIISNRLPVTIENDNGKYAPRQSSGGLISSVKAYMDNSGDASFSEKVWIGLPGCTEKEWKLATDNFADTDFTYRPVFIPKKTYDLHYNGFSNSVIWPLFHYFPSYADYNSDYYQAYQQVNQLFAEELSNILQKDDVVWIHDYQLLPLAGLLREKFPTLTIGFFLHIPFPSYELFRLLPKQWQQDLLRGMLGADLIGFHIMDYAAHFLSCAEAVLKVECDEDNYITWGNRKVKIDSFPISIDFKSFYHSYSDPEVAEMRNRYLQLKDNKKMLFSVDRLDYTKGVSNRLKGFEKFLTEYPHYAGNVIFVLVVVPSRDSIRKYAERKKLIDEYVSNLNSRLGSITWQPVIYQYDHLSFQELAGLYAACDIALITPLRDGMNLVSKEFVASRKDEKGVLILSEMTGAAKELTEALLINPNDINEIAAMIKEAIEMPEEEQAKRIKAMQERISRYDVNEWANDYFSELKHAKAAQLEFDIKFMNSNVQRNFFEVYESATKRLILLDYDGTLMPFSKIPSMAKPSREVLELLQNLGEQERNDVYIISGRDSSTLNNWLGHLPVGLIAEHGSKIRTKDKIWQSEITGTQNWKPEISKLMNRYVSKCPHSFIEEKEFSLAWHYRNASTKTGNIRAKELYKELHMLTQQWGLTVLNGNKVIEVRNNHINKGTAVEKLLYGNNYDFIFAAGDDVTDEDMFKALANKANAVTVKVGSGVSFAKYYLYTPFMVQILLSRMSIVRDQYADTGSRKKSEYLKADY